MTRAESTYALFLNQQQPGRGTWRLALLTAVVSVLAFLSVLPFVGATLPVVPAFIPAYEGALSIIEILTAVLLLGQYLRGAALRVLLLACGYLFNAGMAISHALSFPGAFAPQGLIGGGAQTTAWLYTFWHAGFPLVVLAFALTGNSGERASAPARQLRALLAFLLVTAGVALIGVLCTAGHGLLPIVMRGHSFALFAERGVSAGMIAICLVALVLLLRRKPASVLDVWLAVVMLAWMLDITMSSIIGASRYDVGWYMGRLFGLGSGVFVLAVLLLESNALHDDLAHALARAEESKQQALRSREELAHGQRLEAIGQLTGGIAHDFNNVLQVIGASLSLLQMRLKDNPAAVDLIGRAQAGVSRGARLSGELLAFGRRQPLRPRITDIGALLGAMAEVARRTLGLSIAVETRIAPGLWPCSVDPALLENALLNLILNARDAIADNGVIVLGADNVRADALDVADHADVPAADYVRLSVSDNGAGIAPEHLARVREPFFTTKGLSGGSGLGLSMVHGFAKQSTGHLDIHSTLGQGTTVSLLLPRSLGQVELATPRSAASTVGGSETILVVEDHPDLRHIAVQTLTALGYRVLQAHDAASALVVLESDLQIDVLFSDVIMPGPVRTADMAARARQLRPGIVVLFTSGYIANVIGELGILESDVNLLSKPYSAEVLDQRLRELIDAR
jgi:signal transduction histidine kinase